MKDPTMKYTLYPARKIFKINILLVYMALFSNALNAQDSIYYAIRMLAKPSADSIMLRWAPVNYDSWERGIKEGYNVIRYTLYRDDFPVKVAPVLLNAMPIKPLPLQEWEPLADKDRYAGIAAQAIYGESFEPQAQNNSSAISILNKANEQQNRFSFAMFAADISISVAKGMGLSFTDRHVKMGEKYLYIVVFAGTDKLPADTAYVYTGPDEYKPLAKPRISSIEAGDRQATLAWNDVGGRASYTSYDIQRSDNFGLSFQGVNTSPVVNTYPDPEKMEYNFYVDTLPENYREYVYRIRGVSPFGEKGPYSDTMSVMGLEAIREIPQITKHEIISKGVALNWEFTKKSQDLITGFRILRSVKSDRDYVPVSCDLPSSARNFIDTLPLGTAYYEVQALNDRNLLLVSFPILAQRVDSIPPAPPTGLVADADTSGKVILRWRQNNEEDMYGYRIYRANTPYEEFSQITVSPVRDTTYTDHIQLKTLTKKVYYKLMAIDNRQNHSKFSQIFEISRPDIVSPVPPIIKNITSSSEGITLEWVNSTSKDVAFQWILRRKQDSLKWDELEQISDSSNTYTDTSATIGILYQYTLRATDSSGLKSNIEQIVAGIRQTIRGKLGLSAKADLSNGRIVLTWSPVKNDGKYTIFRGVNGAPPETYAAVNGGNGEFSDEKVRPEDKYAYLVKYQGDRIYISNTVLIKY